MSDKTAIEWTDATWNPVTGCTKVSKGCDRCYAETFAERFRGTAGHYFEQGFDVQLRPEMLARPLRWRKPRRIFVNSMSDLFHKDVPDDYIAKVLAIIALSPQHTFQLLTKRHGRMESLLNDVCRCGSGHAPSIHLRSAMSWAVSKANPDRVQGVPDDAERRVYKSPWPLPNLWLGVSAEDQAAADLRVPALLRTPATVRFISAEPLLGPITFRWAKWHKWRDSNHLDGLRHLDWVIVGGESGHGARPMSHDWARAIRDECAEAGVSFLFKQWGSGSVWLDKQGDLWTLGADGLLYTPETAPFSREHVEKKWGPLRAVGKSDAGRMLDGRTHDEFPVSAA